MKDLYAYGIVLRRLDPSLRPESINNLTTLQLYTMVANTHKASAIIPYRKSYKKLINTKFTTSATDYCDEFQKNFSNFCNAAVNLQSIIKGSIDYGTSDGYAAMMFFEGTPCIGWLET